MKKQSGFTLIELIIVMVVIGLVMSFAIPSMQTFNQNDRLTTNINTMISHLAYARSEAVKRSAQVSICASGDGVTCGASNWRDGWLVYVDADQNGTLDGGEEIMKVQGALDASQTTGTGGGLGLQVTYDNRGFAATGSTGAIGLCDGRSGPYGKVIWITNTGRVRLEKDAIC